MRIISAQVAVLLAAEVAAAAGGIGAVVEGHAALDSSSHTDTCGHRQQLHAITGKYCRQTNTQIHN